MKRKNIPPALLMIVPWLMIMPIVFSLAQLQLVTHRLFEYASMAVYAAFPVTLVLNVFCAYFGKWDTYALVRWGLGIKLFLIPIYGFLMFFAICVPIAIPFLFVFDAALLLVSSGYGIRGLLRAKKEERVGPVLFWTLFLSHFIFVADVIAAVILNQKLKDYTKTAISD